MKNKHLVLLFMATLIIGWLLRRAPWRAREWFQTELIQIDTSRLSQVRIAQPGQPELLLERTDAGWAAQQEGRSVMVRTADMAPMLQALAGIRSIRIVQTKRPDTLGLAAIDGLQVTTLKTDGTTEDFWIGREITENNAPASFLRLTKHAGNYLVEGHLRAVFARTLEDFRASEIYRFQPEQVTSLTIEWPAQAWLLQLHRDSTGRWQEGETDSLRTDSAVLAWLRPLAQLPRCPYADYFDDSRAVETLRARITLEFGGLGVGGQGQGGQGQALTLRVFQIDPADLPENLADLYREKIRPAPFVLHSSQNPNNYFALADTAMAWQICYGLDSSALLLPVVRR